MLERDSLGVRRKIGIYRVVNVSLPHRGKVSTELTDEGGCTCVDVGARAVALALNSSQESDVTRREASPQGEAYPRALRSPREKPILRLFG